MEDEVEISIYELAAILHKQWRNYPELFSFNVTIQDSSQDVVIRSMTVTANSIRIYLDDDDERRSRGSASH